MISRLLFFLLFLTTISHTQIHKSVCNGSEVNAYTRVGAPVLFEDRALLNKQPTSDFIVDYDDGNYYVPLDARTAFDYAVTIWSYLLKTTQPIKIKVEFHGTLEGENSLAEAHTMTWRNNFIGAVTNMQYSIALAKQIDPNIVYTDYDMKILFKSGADWNYEIDGIPKTDLYDFVTVALHEIEHGLGFAGSMNIEGGAGSSKRC